MEPVLQPEPNTSDFMIYHMDETGKPDKVYNADAAMATCVIRSINVTRKMLKTEEVRKSFEYIAKGFCELEPKALFLEEPATEEELMDITNDFLNALQKRWPFIFVSDKLKHPRCWAYTPRRLDEDFYISNAFIVLNGPSLQKMLAQAIAAHSSLDKDDLTNRDYKGFQFLFAISILHELAHVFITYLTEGKKHTPRKQKVYDKTADGPNTQGESGCMLEQLVFGGLITNFRDPIVGSPDDSCGALYVHTPGGQYRIPPETVDKTLNCEFEFPLVHGGFQERIKRLETMDPSPFKPEEDFCDPISHPAWPKLREDSLAARA